MNAPPSDGLELREVCGAGSAGEIVRGVSARFAPGRFHVLRGPADGGKEVLLRLLGLLQAPDGGEVVVQGFPTASLSDEARAELRAQRFGFIFAAPFLLTSFSVIENVAMPLFKISHVAPDEARRRTEALLAFAGLADFGEWPVEELPPSAQYRVALARGLVNEPAFLVVENLDGVLAGDDLPGFIELLGRAGEAYGATIIATASPALPLLGEPRVLDIAGGAILADTELLPEPGA